MDSAVRRWTILDAAGNHTTLAIHSTSWRQHEEPRWKTAKKRFFFLLIGQCSLWRWLINSMCTSVQTASLKGVWGLVMSVMSHCTINNARLYLRIQLPGIKAFLYRSILADRVSCKAVESCIWTVQAAAAVRNPTARYVICIGLFYGEVYAHAVMW